jgi:hypothetical protein
MSIEALKEDLANATRDTFEVGDVVRWLAAGKYNYAAIKTPVGWYTTASTRAANHVHQVLTYTDLVEVLRAPDVSQVEVATQWAPVTDR